MIAVRKADDRGKADHGWLNTHFTFSFADYHDPDFMGFQTLRVINEDRILGGTGFDFHPHRDMEIVTIVLQGALRHRDSLGSEGVIKPGEVQRMSAGTGIVHSEDNASDKDPIHLYQIWILPEKKGLTPSYEQKKFDLTPGQLNLLVSPGAENGALKIHQDAKLYRAQLSKGQKIEYPLADGRHAWIQMISGTLNANDTRLEASDGAAVSDEISLTFKTPGKADFLLFDLA